MEERSNSLRVLSTVRVLQPIVLEKTVICSPFELIAIVTHAHEVVVYRLNGQIAFTVKNPESQYGPSDDEPDVKVSCIDWSPDGRRLVVAWTDGTWTIHETEKGEVVFEGNVREEESGDCQAINLDWKSHDLSVNTVAKQSEVWKQKSWLDELNQQEKNGVDSDLPRMITGLDITSILPKLSALPAHGLRAGLEGSKFSNQTSTNNIFANNTKLQAHSTVETLLIHSSDGSSHVLLDGTFHVGTIKGSTDKKAGWTLNTAGDVHAEVWQSQPDTAHVDLHKLPLVELNSSIMHNLSHAISQIKSLTVYAQRTVQCIVHDFTTGQAYPDRLLRSISGTLEDNASSSSTLTSALHQLAMTGEFHADVLEWLVDIVKETGLKRWDASISTMYSSIQTHLHGHIFPACDRLSIVASDLRGLARLHEGGEKFAPEEALFTKILERVNNLRLSSMQALQICVQEWVIWRAFAKWLKMQVEIAAAGPGSKAAIETEDRESLGIDSSRVLHYIDTILAHGSGLKIFVIKAGVSRDQHHLEQVIGQLQESVQSALKSITTWQARLFTPSHAIELQLSADVRLLDVAQSDGSILNDTTSLFLSTMENSALILSRRAVSNAEKAAARSTSDEDRRVCENIIDAKFCLHGQAALCLSSDSSSNAQVILFTLNAVDKAPKVLHKFTNQDLRQPKTIIAGGRIGKEFCVVFSGDARSWQVLDLRS